MAEGIKRFLIDACRDRGIRRITTNHHRDNHAIIGLSRKLGFAEYLVPPEEENDEPGHIFMERYLNAE